MSRLWDTPAYWARSEADEMLREMADMGPGAVANSFERSAANYDGDPEMATAIIAELRRRADAGVRFWPGPQPLVDQPSAITTPEEAGRGPAPLNVGTDDLSDDDIPW